MLPKNPSVKTVLTFDVEMINRILANKYKGDNNPPVVSDLTDDHLRHLALEIQGSAEVFAHDIVDMSQRDDGWLSDFMQQFP